MIDDGATTTIVSGGPIVGHGVLLRAGSPLTLFSSDDAGVLPTISADGGRSWAAPNTTQPTPVGDVQAGAVGPDGTTLFSQSTSFFNVFTGTAPGVDVFPVCSGCAESFAVDSAGLAQIAFWSNAAPDRAGYLYRPVASRSRI